MKKHTPPAADLTQAFAKVKVHDALHVADDPAVEADGEVQAYLVFREIADLYCSKPGHRPSHPQTYFSSEEPWGPYYINLLPYDRNDKGFNPDSEDGLVDFDPDMFDALRTMAADLSSCGTAGSEILEQDGQHIFSCRTIEDFLQSSYNLLIQPECPGGGLTKARLQGKIEGIVRTTAIEKAKEGMPFPDFKWPFH